MNRAQGTVWLGLALVVAAGAPGADASPRGGDPARGEAIYARCQACHALAYDRTGPHHCGLFGRRAGSVPGFAYSPAMVRSGIVWNARTLDWFLTNPTRAVPGTAMGYAGIADPQERADLIAWLRQATASAAICPGERSGGGRAGPAAPESRGLGSQL